VAAGGTVIPGFLHGTVGTTPKANADDVAPAAEMGDGQTGTSTGVDADVKGL
jgi:hypothetical protein